MNIKQHLEAGHYPKDGRGHSIVTTRNGDKYAIVRLDNAESYPLLGMKIDDLGRWWGFQNWNAAGVPPSAGVEHHLCLLPPPPRKVKVQAVAHVNGSIYCCLADTPESRATVARGIITDGGHMVLLTGEYEEPWT